MSSSQERNRKDHHLPRGFLRGFIDPANKDLAKPLWHFDLESRLWSMESPGSIGWERGLYDCAPGSGELTHPDETFKRFEREFPLVRENMLRRNFKGWAKQQKPFLLEYMQMMRARSPLFIEQQTEQNENTRVVRVTEVLSDNQIKVDTLEPYAPPPEFVRNRTITAMREEIQKGADWALEFHWCLRYTRSVSDPFVTADQPIVMNGVHPNAGEAIQRHDTLLFFPICWRACLVGSRDRFDKGTDEATPDFLKAVRDLFFRPSTGYVISPCRISSF